MLASKATYLAGMIDGPDAASILREAAKHPNPVLRVAVAGASRSLSPEAAAEVLPALLHDRDTGVRRLAIGAATAMAAKWTPNLRQHLEALSKDEVDPILREKVRNSLKHH
jgi:HEAT repeats